MTISTVWATVFMDGDCKNGNDPKTSVLNK